MKLITSAIVGIFCLAILGCHAGEVREHANEIKNAKVLTVHRPSFYFGAMESWIKISVMLPSEAEESLYLVNKSETQEVPSPAQICDFVFQLGSVRDAAGDVMLQHEQPAKVVSSFECGIKRDGGN